MTAIVPWPGSIELPGGSLQLTGQSRIIASDSDLNRLARIFADEIRMASGLCLRAGEDGIQDGDIRLKCDASLAGETYQIMVQECAEIVGGNYNSVALGTTTLLQALSVVGNAVTIPRMTIRDAPFSAYRGLMIDLARQWHSVDTLKQLILLARFYKVRYLQLHLSDDSSFTFPTRSFPDLPTPGRHYTLGELDELERFASARGVTLVPELDVPGHSEPMRRVKPFRLHRRAVIDMANERVYEALEEIVGEISDLFGASPYFHIGADECDLRGVGSTEGEKTYMTEHGLADAQDLYLHFIVRMNEIVKKHGKQTLVWEGFRGTGSPRVTIPDDIIVFGWETLYELPQNLLANGYRVVNASWKPLYVVGDKCWSPEEIYGWNTHRWENWSEAAPSYTPIQLEPHPNVIGAQMCAWQQPEWREIPSLRRRLAAMIERIWQPNAGLSYESFRKRIAETDARIGRLISL